MIEYFDLEAPYFPQCPMPVESLGNLFYISIVGVFYAYKKLTDDLLLARNHNNGDSGIFGFNLTRIRKLMSFKPVISSLEITCEHFPTAEAGSANVFQRKSVKKLPF